MNNFRDKIASIKAKSKTSTKRLSHLPYYSPGIEVVSEYFSRSFTLPCDIDVDKLTSKSTYDSEVQKFLDGDYYIILRNLSDEKISEIVHNIPNNIPIIIESGLDFLSMPNVFYSLLQEIDITLLYNILKSDRAVNEPYIYTINIRNITDKELDMLKEIEDMINPYRLQVYINSKNSFLKLGELLRGRENRHILVILSDNLFWSEDLNPDSAKSLLMDFEEIRKMHNLIASSSKLNLHYLDINKFDDIVNFERIVDTLISAVPSNASDIDKVTFITLFMINNFKCGLGFRNLNELLEVREGKCNQLSMLVKILLNHLGVKCETTGGQALDNWKVGHDWNVVIINGENYFLDITWLIDDIQNQRIKSFEESVNYLTDNICFNLFHNRFMCDKKYKCKYYPREDIRESISRVNSWLDNYSISLDSIKSSIRELYFPESDMGTIHRH